MATTYLSRSASGGSRTTWTISAWVKRSELEASGSSTIFNGIAGSSTNETQLLFNDDRIEFYDWTSSTRTGTLLTNRKFRDVSAWYHIVAVWDTTNATAGNRMRLYVNGVEETSFETDTQPSSSQNSSLGNGSYTQQIGLYASNSDYYFNGLMSHFHFCDGYAYDASAFGSTDSTTGEWKIKTSPNVTYGTNGFFILKDGNSVTDQSGEGNNFTVANGTLTNTEDCPSDVFATINPLQVSTSNLTFSHGNTKVTRSGNWRGHMSTLGVNKGKYYWECKCNDNPASTGNIALGIAKFGGDVDSWSYLADSQSWLGDKNDVWILYNNNQGQVKYTGGSNGGNWGSATGDGEIVMIAFDADNGIIWTGNNGTWDESATEAEIEAGTTTNAMYSGITIGTDLFGAIGSVENGNLEYNFGNGYFGTTAVSSAGTNASGIGIFEYDVPTGFTALSTKGLNA